MSMAQMRDRVMRHATSGHSETAIPRLSLSKVSAPRGGVATVLVPVACLALQGEKRVTIGSTVVLHDSTRCFVASLDMPATGRIVTASPERPYLGAGLLLDRPTLVELVADMPMRPESSGIERGDWPGFAAGAVTADLLDAWAGLLALLDRPEDIAALAAAREREVLYRLLQGPLGIHLRQYAREHGRLARIRRAIGWIRDHHDQAIRTATLAEIAGMSVAAFHRHFKAATSMSPLQFQKGLRLHAARRLLISGTSASGAAYSVGYESASQFSREYARFFGSSPTTDMAALR